MNRIMGDGERAVSDAGGTKKDSDTELLYDGECLMCQHFAKVLENTNGIFLVDGRQPSRLLDTSRQLGFDIDRGILIHRGGNYYYAAEALHYIASHAKGKGVCIRLTRFFFRYRIVVTLSYPVLVGIRRLLLILRRKPLIKDTNPGNTDTGI